MGKKRIIAIITFSVIFILLIFSLEKNPQKTDFNQNQNQETFSQSVEIEKNGYKTKIVWYFVPDISKINLIPNFIQKYTSSEIIKKYNCKSLFNASFYTPSNSPIGLFVNDSQTLNENLFSNFFNGYLEIDKNNNFKVGYSLPIVPKIAIQSGPVVVLNETPLTLKIIQDSQARRVIASQTTSNELVFIVLYDSNSAFSGPFLEDVPQLLLQFQKETNLKIKNAINLDGGSASTFRMPNFQLSEISPVGSFFCEKI